MIKKTNKGSIQKGKTKNKFNYKKKKKYMKVTFKKIYKNSKR